MSCSCHPPINLDAQRASYLAGDTQQEPSKKKCTGRWCDTPNCLFFSQLSGNKPLPMTCGISRGPGCGNMPAGVGW